MRRVYDDKNMFSVFRMYGLRPDRKGFFDYAEVQRVIGLAFSGCRLMEYKSYPSTLGGRFGLIRFGSRAEVFLPLGAKVEVKVGQNVKGASTIIARR